MDLLSEASSGSHVLAPRHISAEKTLPEMNDSVNTSFLCHSYSMQPDVGTYFAALQSYGWVLGSCGALVLLALCLLYAASLRAARRHWHDSGLSAAIVLSVYPLVAASAFITLMVPRARILSEALAQQVVMVAMYHLYSMILAECGGADKLIRHGGGSRLETRVLPCCCWPCCVIPRPKLEKRSLSWLHYLVLQIPVIQAIIYIVILVLWAEDPMLYNLSYVYIQPFVAASILSGVWGIIMLVRAAEAAGRSPRPRFLAVQLVLIIVKVQCGLAKMLPEIWPLPCGLALHPSVVVYMTHYSIIMLEMLLLSLWAWRLYQVPPGKAPTITKVQQIVVAVLEDSASADMKNRDEKSFKIDGAI